jgi:hypothetical protein
VALVLLGFSCTTFSGTAQANSLNLSYGQLKQHTSYLDEAVTLKPVGPSLSLSLDLNEQWSVDLGYNKWSDELTFEDIFTADSDLKTWGGSVNYYRDKWSFSFSYNDSQDDSLLAGVRNPDERYRSDKTSSTSYGASAGYGWVSGNLFYNVSFGAQMADWDSTSITLFTPEPEPNPPGPPPGGGGGGGGGGGNPPPPPPPPEPPQSDLVTEVNSGDSSSISTSFSVARFWSLTEDTGVLVGGILSWNHMLSGDSVLVSSNGRNIPTNRPNQGGNNANGGGAGVTGGNDFNRAGNTTGLSSVSGDDSYGQVSVYVSYDLTESVSVDFDYGVDIGTDENDAVWSVSLGYFF